MEIKTVNQRRIKLLASDIINLCEGYEGAEYQAALTLALGIYFKSMFPHDLESVFKFHIESLRNTLEELDSAHHDDVLELTGVSLS